MRMKTATVSPTSMTSSQPEQVATETLSETQNSAQSDVSTIAWSPDGHFIASGSNDSTVWVRNVITRKIALKKQQPAEVQSVAWSPDGGQLFVYGGTGSFLVDAITGEVTPIPYVAGYGGVAWLAGS